MIKQPIGRYQEGYHDKVAKGLSLSNIWFDEYYSVSYMYTLTTYTSSFNEVKEKAERLEQTK